MPGIKAIIEALGIIKTVPAADLEKIAADLAKGDMNAERLSPGEVVTDFRTQGQVNASPTREEIRVGPSEESSGAGAEHMIRQYSNPVPQMGIALTAETFERLMMPMATSMKSMADGVKALTDRLPVAKAEAEDEKEKESDEEEAKAVAASNVLTAKSLIIEAAASLAKAEDMEDEAEDEDDDMKAKKARREARRLKKSAALLLSRARTRAYAAKSAELKVQIRALAAKADVDIPEDEDEKKEEKAKAEAPAANQADHANKDGNQDDSAKAAVDAEAARIKKALEDAGVPMLTLKINEVMDVLQGKSRIVQAPVFDIAKAKPDFIVAKTAAIPAAVTAGRLSEIDASIAGEILNMQKNAEAGNIDMAFVKARLMRAPQAVQDFLAAEAA